VNPLPEMEIVWPATADVGDRDRVPEAGAVTVIWKVALFVPPPPDSVMTTLFVPALVPMGTTNL